MKQVRETAAGQAISAWIILKEGKHIGTVHAHYSNGGVCTVNVWDRNTPPQFGKAGGYGYDKFTAALSGMTIDGVRMYDHSVGDENTACILKEYQRVFTEGEYTEAIVNHAKGLGMKFANYSIKGWSSCHYIGGLDRLKALGYTVIQAI